MSETKQKNNTFEKHYKRMINQTNSGGLIGATIFFSEQGAMNSQNTSAIFLWLHYWIIKNFTTLRQELKCQSSMYTAIFLQTSRYRHVSVTVWETRHIKTIRPVQNRGLTWYRRSHIGTLAFNSHCTWTRQCSHRTVQFPQRHVRC